MLVDFTVRNFASFKDETTLSAETGERLRKYKYTNTFADLNTPLLKNLILVGPNGSGKSQLIKALKVMQSLVINPTHAVTDKLFYNPFQFDKDSNHQDTFFEVNIELDDEFYNYSFSYNSERILEESLYKVVNNHKKPIFLRKNNELDITDKKLLDSKAKLRPNALFLFLAQSENNDDAVKVFKWFKNDLLFVGDSIPVEMINLMQDAHLKDEMLSFLNFADFNITDITVRDVPTKVSDKNLSELLELLNVDVPKTMPSIFTVHKVYDQNKVIGLKELNLSQESRGTQRIFYIVLSMMLAQINGNKKTIFIDEFDDSLHYELSSEFMKLFNSKENMNQFIISTHNVKLLDENIRVDQIYLLDKLFTGVSTLTSVFDIGDAKNKGRKDVSFAKRYIDGRFGSLPIINSDSLQKMLKIIHDDYGVNDGKET